MSEETIDVEYEHGGEATREEAAALLREIADGVADGSVTFDDGALTARLPDRFDLELEYEREGDAGEIEIELEWPVDDGDDGESEADEDDTESGAGDEDGESEADEDDEASASAVGDQRVGAAEASGERNEETGEDDPGE